MRFFFFLLQILEDRERKNNVVADQLKREQRYLTRRLETLTEGHYRVRQERSISECSTSTNSTTSSTSESGEFLVLHRFVVNCYCSQCTGYWWEEKCPQVTAIVSGSQRSLSVVNILIRACVGCHSFGFDQNINRLLK